MLVKLKQLGLIKRERAGPRQASVVVPQEQIPRLDDVEGPPW
jgi:hypothetical protein